MNTDHLPTTHQQSENPTAEPVISAASSEPETLPATAPVPRPRQRYRRFPLQLSLRRIASSRFSVALSRSARSQESKQISSRSNLRHGLLADQGRLDLYIRYEAHLHRIQHRAIRSLLQLQRWKAHPQTPAFETTNH